jgi:DNA-binding response OmpR family regulator
MAHILLIEPDAVLAHTYTQALTHAGHHVHAARTAQQAILTADTQHPDIVILEMQLSGHSGIEFLYEFRSYPEWQTVPVIILSMIPEREFSGSRAILKTELSIDSFWYKPTTTLDRLVTVVNARTASLAA